MHRIRRGLNVPIAGEPEQQVDTGAAVSRVALVGPDYIGMKPTIEAREGDVVKRGQLVFTDKKTAGVRYTSPTAGTVQAVNRGDKRVFQSVVIQVDGDDAVTVEGVVGADFAALARDAVVEKLNEIGLWVALRTRPFSKVPALDSEPSAIFVQAMDTAPLAANPVPLIQEREDDFVRGLTILSKLTAGPVYVCKAPETSVPGGDIERVKVEEFEGPHPAGLPGTHIHFLHPVSRNRTVWTINWQDVLAFGEFFRTGQLPVDRIVSLAGPLVEKPRLVRTRLGADLGELTAKEVPSGYANNPDAFRLISGSVLNGRASAGPFAFLGRYHDQVCVLEEGHARELIGWLLPGGNKHSITGMYVGHYRGKRFQMTTNQMGSKRAMVPIGTYEDVMPLDILPTQLLRALIIEDVAEAELLGVLELDEEDLALCTYVCPGKYEYGDILRRNLLLIEKEG